MANFVITIPKIGAYILVVSMLFFFTSTGYLIYQVGKVAGMRHMYNLTECYTKTKDKDYCLKKFEEENWP
jgi:hypothetical protein